VGISSKEEGRRLEKIRKRKKRYLVRKWRKKE
jgi:hypothetical protein